MRFQDIIIKKRNGCELSNSEIEYFIQGVTAENENSIPPEQVSALLMAICLKGMTAKETVTLTKAMARSGDTADLSGIAGVKVDKHSTGGVGDKTTLIIAPVLAACGVKVAKMSGRGLGHTGGTVDKLEAIPGFKTKLATEDFIRAVNSVGACVIGQSERIAPADKKLYALRDVTGTVESLPLIASSIMSKKLAAGADCILLDVKVGSGAFMKTLAEAEKLAVAMVDIGKGAGLKTAAVISGMSKPLGFAIGNSLEIAEAVEVLRGGGPEDLKEVCIVLAAKLLQMADEFQNGKGKPQKEYRAKIEEVLNNSAAFNKLYEMVTAQGGDAQALFDFSLLPGAAYSHEIKASGAGFIQSMDAERWGTASAMLGAGRKTKDGEIDYGAGIVMSKKTGDFVNAGEKIAVMYANDKRLFQEAEETALDGIKTEGIKPNEEPLIYKSVD